MSVVLRLPNDERDGGEFKYLVSFSKGGPFKWQSGLERAKRWESADEARAEIEQVAPGWFKRMALSHQDEPVEFVET